LLARWAPTHRLTLAVIAGSDGAETTKTFVRAAVLALIVAASSAPLLPVAGAPVPARAQRTALSPRVPAPSATITPFAASLAEPVAPGVDRRHGSWTTTDGVQVVELVSVDPQAEGISIETSRPAAGVHALESVRSQASRVTGEGHRVVAAVNGDVWSTDTASGTHAPIGLQVRAGELLTATRVAHPTLGLDAAEAPRLDDVAVTTTLTLPDGITTLALDRVNKPRRAGDAILYSRRWGASTDTTPGGVEVTLAGAALPLTTHGTWTATVASVGGAAGDTPIAAGTLVLSADGIDEPLLAGLVPGSTVTLSTAITAGWEDVIEAVGGREWLREGGVTAISPVSAVTTSAHPRTAVGLRADGSLVLATVDGRQPGYSIGVRAVDLADLLGSAGAVDAIMLDGGGSTTALVRRPGNVEATVVNRPSDGRERSVDNVLLVVSSTPTGPLAGLVVRPSSRTLVVGEDVPLATKGFDAAWNGVPVAPSDVTWSLDGSGGTLGPDGVFAAQAPGTMTVTGSAGGLVASARLRTVPDTFAPVAARPVARLLQGATARAGVVPMTLGWSAATDTGTGVVRYELRRRVDGGPWTAVALPSPRTRRITIQVATRHAVQYGVRAIDGAGNTSAWATGGGFSVRLVTEMAGAIRYRGSWPIRTDATALGGTLRTSRTAGTTATYTFTGSQVAWIAPRGSTRGSARVSIDGVAETTVDLNRSLLAPRRLVFTRAFQAVGRHRITVTVKGTAGHPRVDIDGFAVVDPASGHPVLVGAGDIASCGLTGDSATAALLDRIPGTVFAAGDIAYESGTAAQFADCYDPTWGRFKSRTRPVPGNHDYVTAGAVPYYDYFGDRAGTPGQGWYAYDMGAWRVYALNSNCTFVGGCDEGSAQLDWLTADLAAHPRACVAAIWHHPLFSSGFHGSDSTTLPFWRVLDAAGADLVINGHDHDYERFAPQTPDGTADAGGIREFVVGTGGADLRDFATIRANSVVRKTGLHGVLKLELKTTGYTWTFVGAGGSTWTDTGSASCH